MSICESTRARRGKLAAGRPYQANRIRHGVRCAGIRSATAPAARVSFPGQSEAALEAARASRGACRCRRHSRFLRSRRGRLELQGGGPRRAAGQAQLSPASGDLRVHPLADHRPRRRVARWPQVAAGVDQHLSAIGSWRLVVLGWIEGCGPGLAQDLHVHRRVAADGHCPEHLVQVRRIDVFVHRDDPLRVISRRGGLRRDGQHLGGVTGVVLLYRDGHGPKPDAAAGCA